MRCLICKRIIQRKLTFSNIFKHQVDLVCDYCFKRYPFHICCSTLPIGKNINIYSLFEKKNQIPDNAFLIEYSRIFEYILNNFSKSVILVYNNLYLNDFLINNLEIIAKLFNNEIYILCNYLSN